MSSALPSDADLLAGKLHDRRQLFVDFPLLGRTNDHVRDDGSTSLMLESRHHAVGVPGQQRSLSGAI